MVPLGHIEHSTYQFSGELKAGGGGGGGWNPICDFSRSNQMPSTDQRTYIAPSVRTYILVNI